MARTNGVIDQSGTFDFSTPETKLDTSDERQTANLANSKKWKAIVKYIESRQEFYKQYLPGSGLDINGVASEELAIAWKTAHNVIREYDDLRLQVEGIKDALQK